MTTEIQERESLADELIDELVPEGLNWERLVVTYPIPALLIAAAAGFLLGRRHGPEIVAAVSGFAAAEVSRNIEQILGREAG
jgi:membrane protein DedA with SNARE-associated domain